MGPVTSRISRCSDSQASTEQPEAIAGPSFTSGSRRKRKHSGWDCSEPISNTPRSQSYGINLQSVFGFVYRKKVKLSSRYAYQTLFLEGKDSDIKIHALGEVWDLHKVFLCQSGYFANMLKDTWRESHSNFISLEIKKGYIDVRSLHFVFGSLYSDEDLPMEPFQVPRVLAAACLLQVEKVIQQCNETMKKTISKKTVCSYYMAAETYGLYSVKTQCFEWLLYNLMIHPTVGLYKGIDIKLMYLLVSSSNLLVLENEINIYTTLKKWLFLYFNPYRTGRMKYLSAKADLWLSRFMERNDNGTFLESEEGLVFQPVFKQLRFQHIICDLTSMTILEKDRLIPLQWLSPIYKQQWLALFQTQQHRKIGPRIINKEELEGCSMRCGVRLDRDGKFTWKWSLCTSIFPLRVIFANNSIMFKQTRQKCNISACLKRIRNVVFRITLVHFDSKEKLIFSRTTGHKIITLKYNEKKIAMKLNAMDLRFPLYIFCNFQFTSLANAKNM